jgi:beta-lactam-binding protein with PASTA domain
VQSQDPAEGTLQPPGTVVRIEVGRNVVVPDVVGDSLDLAVDKIDQAGLRPRVMLVIGPPEIVVGQSPAPNTRLPLGGLVTIRVGRLF